MAEGERLEESSGLSSPWCQFVSTHECRPPVLVSKELFRFGRSPECDFSLSDCKFLSAYHCFIIKDSEGNAWLHDTSTNGTLVNGKKVKSGQSVKLSHKDEIKLVHRKDRDIGFVYHDLKCMSNEDDGTLENTQEYEDDGDSQSTSVNENTSAEGDERTSEKEEMRPRKRPHHQTSSTSETESPTSKRQHIDKNKTEEPKTTELNKTTSSLADNLVCNICQDIFHDCVSLQPCMHSYCAGCYSQWMERSHDCPSCRLRVSRINRNHLVNNLVEAFFKENPERKRPKEEIEELDKKNKITADMLKPPRQRRGVDRSIFGLVAESDSDSYEEDLSFTSESEHSLSEYDDDDDDDDNLILNPFRGGAFPTAVAGLFGFLNRGLSRTQSKVCRQCPSYTPPPSAPSSSGMSTTASTSGNTTSPITPPPYVCSPSRSHILCMCCMQYMPDRRCNDDAANAVPIPRQTCCVCERAFCNLYWGCRGPRCNGCLKEFKDFTFQDSLDKLINDNTYESTILKNYLDDKNIPLDTMFKKCLEKMESKEYKAKDARCENSTSILCKKCALKNFQELAYQYRQGIPSDDLPNYVTQRQDCYWGRNCRTQRKPHHATRFNHICEQKRFT